MKLLVFAVRDSAVGAYNRPFFLQSRGVAVRSFSDEVNNPESPMHKHPSDYELFVLGTWDEDSAHFEVGNPPESICRAADVIRGKE